MGCARQPDENGTRTDRASEARQQEERPSYWAILRESLIRNPLLPPAQLAEQREHIVEVMRSPRAFSRPCRKPPSATRS
ncbi:Scr1 family TA system antitoxin-like transcriptional regulator [Streptomyces sp. NPDC021749]|uniref:Scr1 family TA system antitoxin-like transcriptional regulator n=1 Tax=Streptomyces sp. NPDC021749 TaxID=3154905 RepID=UPI003404A941